MCLLFSLFVLQKYYTLQDITLIKIFPSYQPLYRIWEDHFLWSLIAFALIRQTRGEQFSCLFQFEKLYMQTAMT